jgi:hypothetical protein
MKAVGLGKLSGIGESSDLTLGAHQWWDDALHPWYSYDLVNLTCKETSQNTLTIRMLK